MHDIYTYIPETICVPREYSAAAILLLLFMVLNSLIPLLNLLFIIIICYYYFRISHFSAFGWGIFTYPAM